MSSNAVVCASWQDVFPELSDVSMIYADPPYGTGRTFSTYEDTSSLSQWLEEMRDLLVGAQGVLASDGVIWVHLDDLRAHHVRIIGDEVFGSKNHVGTIAWQRNTSGRSGTQRLVRQVDYIMGWRASSAFRLRKVSKTAYAAGLYGSRDGDPASWRRDNLSAPGLSGANCHYGITNPLTGVVYWPPVGSHWRWDVDRALRALSGWGAWSRIESSDGPILHYDGSRDDASRVQLGIWPVIYFGTTGQHAPQRKTYHSDDAIPSNFWPAGLTGTTSDATRELKSAVGRRASFDTPKPERLMERLIAISTDSGDTVVDPYAGSGTTGVAAARLGRSFVLIERSDDVVQDVITPRLRHHGIEASTKRT